MTSSLSESEMPEIQPASTSFPSMDVVGSTEKNIMLAQKLAEQLQRHHGCSLEAHTALKPSSMPTVSLSEMASWLCPDVLRQPGISQYFKP